MAKTAAVKIEVRWREQGTDQWSDIKSVPVTSKIVVEGLDRIKTYEFEYRGVSACGARSAWGSTAHAIPDVPAGTIVLSDLKTEADNAAADAAAANAELANIASDNVLSQGEKPVVIRDYNVITTEQAGIDGQASSFGITTEKTAYDNAVTALTSYLGTLTSPTAWNNLTGDTTIVGTTFRQKFADVYTMRQTLLNAIYATAKVRADSAQSSATSAASAAAAAQADATSSLSQLADIAADGKLTADEKVRAKQNYLTITGEQGGIDGQATAYGVTTEKTAYDSAITTLKNYLQSPVGVLDGSFNWTGITGTTAITRSAWDNNWTAVYTSRQTLLNAIYAAAKSKADAAQTTANTANSIATQVPVINGGFDATPYGTGWTMDSQWSIKSDGAGPGVGAGYAQFTPNGSNGAIYNNGRLAVVPGQTYKAQGLIRGSGSPNGTAYVRIRWLDATGAQIAYKNGNIVTGNATAGSYAVDQAPAGAYYAATMFEVDSCTTGIYQLDNAVATLMPSHLGEVPDTAGRYAVVNGGSLNAVSSIDGGNRALIDFSQSGHFNKNLDNLVDGGTYIRAMQPSGSGSQWDIDNPTFQIGTLGAAAPGWNGFGSVNAYLQGGTSPAASYGSQYLVVGTGAGGAAGVQSRKTFYPKPGDRISIAALVYANSAQFTVAQVNFYTASNTYISSIGAGSSVAAWTGVSASGSVPSNAAYATVTLQVNAASSFGSFNFVQVTVNDVRVAGSGAKAYVDFSDNTASGHLNKNVDYIGDGATYGRPILSRLSSGVPFIDFAAGIHLNKNLANISDGGGRYAAVQANADHTASNTSALTASLSNQTQDSLADGSTYARVKGTELSSGVHKLGVAGSGALLGSQLNIPNSLTLNYGAVRSATALTATSTGAVSVNAFTYYMGAASPSYSAVSNAVTGLTQGSTYYIYTRDPGGSGGTKTWSATTNINALLQTYDDIVVAGQVTIPTSGSSGGGGTGGCPVVGAWVVRRAGDSSAFARAGDVAEGDELLLTSGKWGRVSHSRAVLQPCVTVQDAEGFALSCSRTAPLGRPDGTQVMAADAGGELIEARTGVVKGASRIVTVHDIGEQWVQHITCENDFFWVGDQIDRLFSHHNLKP